MAQSTITQRTCEFLERLSCNNNKEWFLANKEEYLCLQKELNEFSQELIDGIASFDPNLKAQKPGVKDCTYRIYRDVRFTKNKQPYKTHIGIYVNRGGKKSLYGGYYLHIEPIIDKTQAEYPTLVLEDQAMSLGGSLLACGLYCPQLKILQSVRDEISVNGDSFLDAIKLAKGFSLDNYSVLKKMPKGFDNVNENWQFLLKHKDFSLSKPISNEFLSSSNVLENIIKEFKKTYEFNRVVNLAVDYAIEQL